MKKLTFREYLKLRNDLKTAINRETGGILKEGYSTGKNDDRIVINTILDVLEEKEIIGKA
jgi:hypothetical protein